MELLRRWVLLLCTAVGIFLAMTASLSPKIAVRAVDFKSEQQSSFGWSEQDAYLRQLPLPKYIEETTKSHSTIVSGDDWASFFENVQAASADAEAVEALKSRVYIENRWSDPPFEVFFQPDEAPLGDVVALQQSPSGERHYLIQDGPNGREYLEVAHYTYDSDDLGFGAGLSNPPPAALLYPYRSVGLGIIAFGVGMYVVLPRRRRDRDAVCYAWWTVIPGDFLGLLLFVTFFTLPFLLVGSAVHTITHAWPFLLVMWPLAFLGGWLLIHIAEYAAYELHVQDDDVVVDTPRGRFTYTFASMVSVQPLVLRTPDWLRNLSWLAAASSQGSSQLRMTGQAISLGNMAAQGLCIRRNDGTAAYLWVPNAASRSVYRNAERLMSALEDAGIPWEDEAKIVKALVRPDGEGVASLPTQRMQGTTLGALIVFPLAVIGIGAAVWWGMETFDVSDRDLPDESDWDQQMAQLDAVEFPAEDVVWEKRYRAEASPMLRDLYQEMGGGSVEDDQNVQAAGLRQLADGNLLVYGSAGPAMYQDGYVLKTDTDGAKLWEFQYGAAGKNSDCFTAACPGHNGSILLLGTSGSYSAILGGSRAYLVSISDSGEKQWELFWGDGPSFPEPDAAISSADGSFIVFGHLATEPSTVVFLLHISAAGELLSEQTVDIQKAIGDVHLRSVTSTQDGGFVVTGQVAEPDRYKDLLVARFDSDGGLLWTRSLGGPKLETGVEVSQTPDGGHLACGMVDSFDDSVQPYVVRLDTEGETVWESIIDVSGECEIRGMELTDDQGAFLVGDYRVSAGSRPKLFLIRIDADGTVLWEKYLEQPSVIYSAASAVETTDGIPIVLATRSWADHAFHCASLIRVTD